MTTPSPPSTLERTASFSRCGTFRYSLNRRWQDGGVDRRVTFIGLNPSTADHRVDDPTIRRCMDFSQRWGFNALSVVNLFAFRTPYPKELKAAKDPIGPYNTRHVTAVVNASELVIACWGRDGRWLAQDERLVRRFAGKLSCLAANSDGSPAHPLYQRATTLPSPWR